MYPTCHKHMSISPNPPEVRTHPLKDDTVIPNNPRLPLLVYLAALDPSARDLASAFESLFAQNHWGDMWRYGVYRFHHYHSKAHEVLGVFRGSASIQFGGEKGIVQKVKAGDMVVIPAGVGHKNLHSSLGFSVVGAYPFGQTHDMCYGNPEERDFALGNIAHVPLPESDPLYGSQGPLLKHWS